MTGDNKMGKKKRKKKQNQPRLPSSIDRIASNMRDWRTCYVDRGDEDDDDDYPYTDWYRERHRSDHMKR